MWAFHYKPLWSETYAASAADGDDTTDTATVQNNEMLACICVSEKYRFIRALSVYPLDV